MRDSRNVNSVGLVVVSLTLALVVLSGASLGQQCQVTGSTCFTNSNCCSGVCMQPAPGCHTELCPTAACLGTGRHFNIKTSDAVHFVTAVNGGGVGGPNSGPQSAAIHTDATTAGAWETFNCTTSNPNNTITFQVNDGNFITAVGGGGVGGPNANPSQLHTDATKAGPWEQFTIVSVGPNQCALKTSSGNFVTAVNGGGWGGSDTANKFPIHTNATKAGQWETFTLIPLN